MKKLITILSIILSVNAYSQYDSSLLLKSATLSTANYPVNTDTIKIGSKDTIPQLILFSVPISWMNYSFVANGQTNSATNAIGFYKEIYRIDSVMPTFAIKGYIVREYTEQKPPAGVVYNEPWKYWQVVKYLDGTKKELPKECVIWQIKDL